MLYGEVPFGGNTLERIYELIQLSSVHFPAKKVSANAKDLITKCLNKDQATRITGDQILKHPFFMSIDFEKLKARKVKL